MPRFASIAFGIMAALPVWAQSQGPGDSLPMFEVASIKPNTSDGPGAGMSWSKSEVRLENYSLKQLIEAAYKIKDYSFAGPPWLDSQRFDIVAKLPPDVKGDGFPAMMQSLLRERFKLAVHRESKVMPVLALTVDKNGLRIKPVEAGQGGTSFGRTMVKASKTSMTQLADALSSALDRPVQDLTGLPGIYDIDLKWLPDDAPPPDALPTGRAPATSVFAALQELGLKLQAKKLPVVVLVVDHAEKPSEN